MNECSAARLWELKWMKWKLWLSFLFHILLGVRNERNPLPPTKTIFLISYSTPYISFLYSIGNCLALKKIWRTDKSKPFSFGVIHYFIEYLIYLHSQVNKNRNSSSSIISKFIEIIHNICGTPRNNFLSFRDSNSMRIDKGCQILMRFELDCLQHLEENHCHVPYFL